MKRIAKAKARKDGQSVKRIRENKPFYKLDHIVKERHASTFINEKIIYLFITYLDIQLLLMHFVI